MINIGGNPLMILLAIIAAMGGIGLYFVRSFRPELARDHDIFFSAIALVYGIILLAFNFRMEITTQLAQVLVVGFSGWFAVETLILRQALSTQARRSPMNNPIEDDPIDNNYRGYRAEIDPNREFAPRRTKNTRQMMQGTSTQQSELRGDVERRSDSRSNSDPRNIDPRNNNDSERKNRRPRRPTDAIIDIDEDDIRPVTPKQRRPKSDRPDSDRPDPSERNRPNNEPPINSEWNSDVQPPRRKRPRNPEPSADYDTDEQDW